MTDELEWETLPPLDFAQRAVQRSTPILSHKEMMDLYFPMTPENKAENKALRWSRFRKLRKYVFTTYGGDS